MATRDIVVVGGSAGSLEPLRTLVSGLAADLPAPVLVTVHLAEHGPRLLPKILANGSALDVAEAQHGEQLHPGQLRLAPPGRHLLMPDGLVELSNGPRVNRYRPAVDAMFASAARWFGERVVAVVLSGRLDDGAVGAALVEHGGGRVIVQHPDDADQPSMPRAARSAAPCALTVPTSELARAVTRMLGERGTARRHRPRPVRAEDSQMRMDESGDPHFLHAGETRLTRLACPECGGVLAEIELPTISFYRCHTGHEYAPQSLLDAQVESTEATLYSALSSLEETAALARHLGEIAAAENPDVTAEQTRIAERMTQLARSVRSELHANRPPHRTPR